VIAAVVDVQALVKVVWTALAGGIGVCVAYSLVVLGLARGGDARRAGASGRMVPYYALAAVGLLVCLFALWRGYLFVVHKS
jgi:hypothetical protein